MSARTDACSHYLVRLLEKSCRVTELRHGEERSSFVLRQGCGGPEFSRASCLGTQVSSGVGRTCLPILSPEGLRCGGAKLKTGGYRSPVNYFCRTKKEQIAVGQVWSDALWWTRSAISSAGTLRGAARRAVGTRSCLVITWRQELTHHMWRSFLHKGGADFLGSSTARKCRSS